MSWATKRVAVVAAVVAIAASACGGSSEVGGQPDGDLDQNTASTEQNPAVNEGSTPSEPTGQDSDESETSSQGDADFCVEMNSSVVMASGLADDDIEALYDRAIEELDGLRSRAPGEVAEDVETLYQSMIAIDDFLAGYGYDLQAVSADEQQALLDETGAGEALARVAEYCGRSSPVRIAGGVGSFTVDGESFDNVDVYRCEPFSFGDEGPDPEDLDLIAGLLDGSNSVNVTIGKLNGDGLSLGVFYSRQGEDGLEQFEAAADNSIPGRFEAGPWKVYDPETGEETELDEPPYVIEGDRIRGGLTGLTQSWPQGGDDTVDVTFDLEIPSEINDCSTGG